MIKKALDSLLIISVMLLNSPTSIQAAAGISVICEENSHTVVKPFEPNFKYLIIITNTGDAADTISITSDKVPADWLVLSGSGFIQLDPGEVGYHAVIVEPSSGLQEGEQLALLFTISSMNDPSKTASCTLTTTVKDLGDFGSLPHDSIVQGKVYDSITQMPIANAEVSLYMWNPNWWDWANTNTDGIYQISSLSYEYMLDIHNKYSTRNPPSLFLEVHAKGYQSYYEDEIEPPRGNILTKNIYLDKQVRSAGYQLSWEKSLGFGVWKSPTAENWDYIAVSTGEHTPLAQG